MLSEVLFTSLQQIIPQHTLSRFTGKFAECRIPLVKNWLITTFANHYGVDLSEAVIEDPTAFENFNAFFTRELKPGAREIAKKANMVACPADGAISEIGDIELGSVLQAKGRSYSLISLLGGDADLCNKMMGGKFATIYLSPKDYHRVHMPLDGVLQSMTYVPGKLFSVNQATANRIPSLFARNERLICHFDSKHGPFVIILVGAMIVAGIETVWAGEVAPVKARIHTTQYNKLPKIKLKKGEEMGRFKLGSTAILLFPEKTVSWEEELLNGSPTRMGQSLGIIT